MFQRQSVRGRRRRLFQKALAKQHTILGFHSRDCVKSPDLINVFGTNEHRT